MTNPEQNSMVLFDTLSGRWLHFSSPRELLRADRLEEVRPLLERADRLVNREGLYAAGFLSYDAAPAFDDALQARRKEGFPLLWFGLYGKPEPIDLPPPAEGGAAPLWEPLISREAYDRGIAGVKAHIRRGDSYQVNYTYRLRCAYQGDPWQLFLKLQAAQNARYGAYADLPDWTICSASPELFFTLEGERVSCRPMKGTAARGLTAEGDRKQAEWLFRSEKNRAENRMIVDMIRNDIGRTARPGSLRVPALFALEKYPTLWQMTTQVEGESAASLPALFDALFPCASITGAPKCRTMGIIRELETSPRGLYTGSIGYMAPGRRAQFNVAIRTVVIDKAARTGEYGTGGGIVWDSTPGEEFEETRTKAKVLTAAAPRFSLLETFRWSPGEGFFLEARHLDRMGASAEYFDFPWDREEAAALLRSRAEGFPREVRRVRLLLDRQGRLRCEEGPFPGGGPRTVAPAAEPVDQADPFLYHKTTRREVYRAAAAGRPEAEEVLLWNSRGELTEGGTANLVLTLGGRNLTPPIACGLLGGTLRAELLARGEIEEEILRLEDLERAEKITLINSLRGPHRGVLLSP